MDQNQQTQPDPWSWSLPEFGRCWRRLPDKALFFGLLGVWAVIFHFLGHCQFGFTDTPSLFNWMWVLWGVEATDSSHGKIILPVVLALLWYKREELLASVNAVWWPALVLLAAACLLHLVGFVAQQPRVSIIALFLGIYGLVGLAWGWKTLKASFFPFVMFAFCMPMGIFIEKLTFSLRLLATAITAFITQDVLGVPVIRVGTQLIDAKGTYSYDVAAACSGIRSIEALLAITIVFAMLLFKRPWRRALMIAFAVPLAIFCNVLRLIAIVLGAQAFGPGAGNFVHEWFGFVTYAVAIASVLLFACLLREKTSSPKNSNDLHVSNSSH